MDDTNPGGLQRSFQDYGLLATLFGMGGAAPLPQANRSDQMTEFLNRKRQADARQKMLLRLLSEQQMGR